jgi:drug/metabolite transporter (DMT)-like permease
MGYIFLLLSKITAIFKMIAVKSSGKIASGAKNNLKINLLRSVGCCFVGAVVCLVSGFRQMDSVGIWISVISGISNGILLFAWLLSAERAPMCLIEAFCMLGGVVFPLLLSPILIKGETISAFEWIGTALLFAAMFCLSRKGGGTRITAAALVFMTLAGIGNMGSVMTQKLYSSLSVGSIADFQLLTYGACAVTLAITLGILSIIDKKSGNDATRAKFSPKIILFITVAVVMMYASQFLSTLASGRLSSAVFYPLSYVISMPLVFLIDVLVYKEKVTVQSIIGILLVTCSGVLINLKI